MRLSQLHPNEGQIKGVPNNPRKISEEEFKKLKRSIYESREFLVARPFIVDEEWNILGGNMRYRACCELRAEKAVNGSFRFEDEIPDEWVKQVFWPRKRYVRRPASVCPLWRLSRRAAITPASVRSTRSLRLSVYI